ncbi:MAG: hypothetical protein GX640_08240 [Fibrobacter sp.]|nr:hypothetical protein [Fibrobacter sp.]
MPFYKKTEMLFISSLIVILPFFLLGCKSGGTRLGQAIPKNIQQSRLSDILREPASFNGKSVVVKGIISGQCPSLCEFFLKDGAHHVTIFPQGYKLPKLQTGKKVTVLATVTTGDENVILSALGIQTE